MSSHSLRARLLVASVASIGIALTLAAFALVALFERHVERRVAAELATYARQLAGNLSFDAEGNIAVARDLADPRFDQPLSGLYWQIQEDASGLRLRSRSLWDSVLPLPSDRLGTAEVHTHELSGPDGEHLLVQERPVIYDTESGSRRLRIAVAVDRRGIEQAGREFAAGLVPELLILAAALSLAAWVQVAVGLRPLESVRRGVGRIRAGLRRRLDDPYPAEIMPLVTEVNDLLDAQDEAIERARNRAADLAHGLRTPLTVLFSDAGKLRSRGEREIADELEDLARSMQRHVDHELARVRVAGEGLYGRVGADLAEAVRGVVVTLRRTPRGEVLDWQLELPDECPVAIDAHDLSEVVGNILENAVKWARHVVRVGVARRDGAVTMQVADDGPGVPEARIDTLGMRGVRLDEQTPGTGMGLAIVREILAAYDADLSFRNCAAGGLEVAVTMKAAGDA